MEVNVLYQHKLERNFQCPLEYGLYVLGGKWKSRIICIIAKKGTMRYSLIRAAMSDISDAVLSATLKEMIKDDLIVRKQFNEIPPRVEYSLTEKGRSLVPILQSICDWSNTYYKEDDDSAIMYCQKCNFN